MKNLLLMMLVACALPTFVSCEKGRMWETPAVRPYEEPLLIMESTVVPFDGGEALYRNVAGDEITPPIEMTAKANITAGKEGYFTYCAQCHGKYHDGNATVGQSFAPLPTDLRGYLVQGMVPGDLFQIISYSYEGSRHPGLATTIAMTERWQIAAYIKSLGSRE